MRSQVYNWLRRALAARCRLCGCDSDGHALCPPCQAAMPLAAPACRLCARPLAVDGAICGRCLRRPPPVGRVVALWRYAPPAADLVAALKYRADLGLLPTLAGALADRVRAAYGPDSWPQQLLPVPLHGRRLRQRGFNQAGELAAALGRQLALPVEDRSLRRVIDTPDQIGLSAGERRRNLRQAFAVYARRGQPLAEHVALLDDVLTTGATALAAVRVLQRAGVARVDVWCLARTP